MFRGNAAPHVPISGALNQRRRALTAPLRFALMFRNARQAYALP